MSILTKSKWHCMLTPHEAYVSSVYGWLENLKNSGLIDDEDTVWAGLDGSYIVGYLDVDDMDEEDLEKYTDAGTVAEFLANGEEGEE